MKRLIAVLASVFAFGYVLVRAIYVDFTFDEIWTVSAFVPLSFSSIVSLYPCDANNHILNTILIKLFIFLFGNSSFACRFPNLIAFAIYLLVAIRMSRLFRHHVTYLITLLLLIANPFVLDFFGLARGYGLAMSFEVASIYCLLSLYREHRVVYLIPGVTSSMLAVLSNFSFLPFMLVYGALLLGVLIYFRLHLIRIIGSVVAVYISFGILILPLLLRLKASGSLYYGGHTGLYADTLMSLLQYSTGRHFSPDALRLPLLIIVMLIIGVPVMAVIYMLIRGRIGSLEIIPVILLLGVVAIVWLMQQIMHTPYPIDRTALFLYPLVCIAVGFSLDIIMPRSPILFSVFALAGCVFLIVNFCLNANIYKTISWNFEAYATEILRDINQKGREDHKKYSVDCSWPLQNQMGYYMSRYAFDHIYPLQGKLDRDSIADGADFYILMDDPMPVVGYDPHIDKVNLIFRHKV